MSCRSARMIPTLYIVLLGIALDGQLFSTAVAEEVEGFTEPYRQIELAAGEPGILDEIHVREGSPVAAGDLVAALDTDVLRATWELARERSLAEGALQASQAECEMRRTQWEQLKTLRDRGHATQRELERAETDYRIAEARVMMAREDLRLHQLEMKRIEVQIARRQIRSPIDGVVSEVFREVGEAFVASDPRVATIVQLKKLRARFSASPSVAAKFVPGQSVSLLVTEAQQTVVGEVEMIAPVIDARSGTVQVVVVIDNPDERIRSGARCLLRPSETPTGPKLGGL